MVRGLRVTGDALTADALTADALTADAPTADALTADALTARTNSRCTLQCIFQHVISQHAERLVGSQPPRMIPECTAVSRKPLRAALVIDSYRALYGKVSMVMKETTRNAPSLGIQFVAMTTN